MQGVMTGFASRVVGRADRRGAELALVGPSVEGVADDPEGAEVLAECTAGWHALPLAARRHIRLVVLPMIDVDENAAMVNALQRSAAIIVQKSIVEGFGLTVAEGMWKAKPVVASGVGGIVDQVVPGTGVLLDDPTDLEAYGDVLADLLEQPEEMARLGASARRHVLREFVGDRHLLQYASLIERVLDA
jgi:trehalose synthase